MTKLTVLGRVYEITYGQFGERLIDGKTLDEFTDWVKENDPDVFEFAARKGQDIAVEIELPEDLKQIMRRTHE